MCIRDSSKDDGKTAALCCDEDIAQLKVKTFSLGKRQDYAKQAHRLFDMLRDCLLYTSVYGYSILQEIL